MVYKVYCLSPRNFQCTKCLDLLFLAFQIGFGIWGCTIMMGEKYNEPIVRGNDYSFKPTWGKDYSYKPEYRRIFEAMVIIRFISLLCLGCVILVLCCCLIPILATASAA